MTKLKLTKVKIRSNSKWLEMTCDSRRQWLDRTTCAQSKNVAVHCMHDIFTKQVSIPRSAEIERPNYLNIEQFVQNRACLSKRTHARILKRIREFLRRRVRLKSWKWWKTSKLLTWRAQTKCRFCDNVATSDEMWLPSAVEHSRVTMRHPQQVAIMRLRETNLLVINSEVLTNPTPTNNATGIHRPQHRSYVWLHNAQCTRYTKAKHSDR